MESLEPRLLLSGNVTVSTIGTSLFAFGDASDNSIVVEQGADFTVTGKTGTATTVNGTAAGTPVHFPDMNGDIWAFMSDGNDVLEVKNATVPGSLWLNGGAGDNTVTIDPVIIDGNVFVMNGTGLDTFNLLASAIVGSLTLLNGDGGSSTTLQQSVVGGGVTIFNGAGSDTFTMDGGPSSLGGVAGSLLIINGDGGSSTTITNSRVFGSVTVLNGEGRDTFDMSTAVVGGKVGETLSDPTGEDRYSDVGIEGNLFIVNGNGGSSTHIVNAMVGGSLVTGVDGYGFPVVRGLFGGSVTILNGDGHDCFTLDNEDYNGGILEGLFIANGEGGSSTRLHDTTVGQGTPPDNLGKLVSARDCTGVTVLNGSGSDCFTLDNTSAGEGVYGNVFLANGNGCTHTKLLNTLVDGNLTVLNGEGFDCFSAAYTIPPANAEAGVGQSDGGIIGDVFIADSGGGSFTKVNGAAVLGSASLFAGDGADHLSIYNYANGGNVFASTGAGEDTVKMDNFEIGGSTYIDTGADDDNVTIETKAPTVGTDITAPLGDLTQGTFGGGFYLNLGSGDDSVALGGDTVNQVVNFDTFATLDGGPGFDSGNEGNVVANPGQPLIINFEAFII
jgi:hypothetical protein